jgi:LysM repeat protein
MRDVRLREGPVVTCIELTVFAHCRTLRSLAPRLRHFESEAQILAEAWAESQRKIRGDMGVSGCNSGGNSFAHGSCGAEAREREFSYTNRTRHPDSPEIGEYGWMILSGPARGPRCERRRAFFCCVIFFLLFATFTYAQDSAGSAEQKSAPNAPQQKLPRHVYTEEDLKKQKILTPEDQARVEARKMRKDAAPTEEDANRLPSDAGPQQESLGEVARRYRLDKAARAAEQAEKNKLTPFPYEVPEGALASPKPGVEPRDATSRKLNGNNRSSPRSSPAPQTLPRGNGPGARISPFQPRPLITAPPAVVRAPAIPLRLPSATRLAPVNPAPSTEIAGLQRVRVQQGESWWKLARRYLGSGARWPELRTLNEKMDEPTDLLRAGSIVRLPGGEHASESSFRRSITVRKGDSLWSIAREYLGHGSAWTCLARVNPQISDYTHMTIGARLQLPEAEALDSYQKGKARKPRD